MGRPDALDQVYGPAERRALARLVEPVGADCVGEVEIVLGTWGMPVLDAAWLARARRLRAIFYAAGSVRGFVTDELWERRVRVVGGHGGNATPVAGYATAAILFSLKWGFRFAAAARDGGPPLDRHELPGIEGSLVGLVSLGTVGRLVRGRLRPFGVRVAVFDPYLDPAEARRLGVRPMALAELFRSCDVVSLHAPLLPETRGLVTGELVASMRPGAALVNTSRGGIVREAELIEALRERPDVTAVLDVTDPEPPAPDSPLRTLPNVVLTPHVAGALGRERRLLGRLVASELRRYLAGQPLRWEVTRDRVAVMATP
jgi:phosphoglycerate dehydrogenase-like enzyme